MYTNRKLLQIFVWKSAQETIFTKRSRPCSSSGNNRGRPCFQPCTAGSSRTPLWEPMMCSWDPRQRTHSLTWPLEVQRIGRGSTWLRTISRPQWQGSSHAGSCCQWWRLGGDWRITVRRLSWVSLSRGATQENRVTQCAQRINRDWRQNSIAAEARMRTRKIKALYSVSLGSYLRLIFTGKNVYFITFPTTRSLFIKGLPE